MKKILILLFLAQISCVKKGENYSELQMISKGVIEFPIDEKSSSAWFMVEVVEVNNQEFFVYHDNLRNDPRNLHFVNISDSSKSFKVSLEIDGPNGIGHLDGFHVRNLDSIFILNRYSYELNLVDTSGKVKDQFRLRSDNSNLPAMESALPFVWTYAPIIDLGKKLLIPSYPDIDPFKNGYQQENLAIILDLDTKKIDYKFGFSDKYIGSGFWGVLLEKPSYSVNYHDSVIVQSFPIEDKIMVYDFNFKLIATPSVFKENYEGKNHSLPEFILERKIFYTHIYSNPKNKAVLYDPYRKMYYRTFSESHTPDAINEILDSPNRSLKQNEKPNLKIMVFDSNFNEVEVVNLDKKKYWIDHIRIVKEGILIQVQTDNEDKNVFEIFEVKL
jgi:hypothetical protein